MYRIHWILDTLDTGYWIQNTGFIRPNRDKDFFGFQISSQIGITFSQPIKWSNQDVFPKTFRSQMRTYTENTGYTGCVATPRGYSSYFPFCIHMSSSLTLYLSQHNMHMNHPISPISQGPPPPLSLLYIYIPPGPPGVRLTITIVYIW